jgi:Arc/MetJ-type ribon-helix-helix transcriptional regulator
MSNQADPEQLDAAIAALVDERNHYMDQAERLREALRRIHAETDVPTTNPYPRETIREIARAALNREGEGK